jgi:hypothetical protein
MRRSLLVLLSLIALFPGCSSAYRSHFFAIRAIGVPVGLEDPVADIRFGPGVLRHPKSAPPCPYYDRRQRKWLCHPPIFPSLADLAPPPRRCGVDYYAWGKGQREEERVDQEADASDAPAEPPPAPYDQAR